MAFANEDQTEDAINFDLLCWRHVTCRHFLHNSLDPDPWGTTLLKSEQCMRVLHHSGSQAEANFAR